jgi:diguanylate cyclase (GGDEF)-like protein
MMAGATSVGVLGVGAQPPLTDHQVNALTAAASLLAVSIRNAELFRAAHETGVRDMLTWCYLRGHAMEVVDAELRRARRSKQPAAVVLFDLDHFKHINDRYGHLAGDAVQAAVGERMHAVLRGSDLKCCYGGEEFLVLLPEASLAGARRVADTLRHDLEARPVRWNDEDIRITASFGITAVAPGEVDAAAVIARADAALYRAKALGRNCVELIEAPSSAA